MKKDRCSVPRCYNVPSINYLGKRVCERCFELHCEDPKSEYLKKKLKLIR